jgi:CHRD domain
MKKMRRLIFVLAAIVSLATTATVVADSLKFKTKLSGDQEVPVRVTGARGQAEFKLSKDGTELRYKLNVSKINNVFQAHIHMAPAGSNGPVVVWLFPSTTPIPGPVGGGRFNGKIAEGTITAANLVGPLAGQELSVLVDAIQAGNAYVNVHTSDGIEPGNTGPGDFPGGEIRGQLSQRGHHHGDDDHGDDGD